MPSIRVPILFRAALAAALIAVPAAAQPAAAPPMLDQVRALGLDSVAGPLPAHYSAGFATRAAEVQAILREAARFFADSLGLPTTVHVAVLAAPEWQRLTQVPYGVPFVNGGVVFIPAVGDGVIAADFLALEGGASPAVRAKVAETRATFADNARRMTDLIGYHELGHGYTRAYGIRSHTRWFNEFLATYLVYAFLHRARPLLARGFEAMVQAKLDGPTPAHTTLADFDRLYIGVGPENYNWYQAAFALQAAEVFQAEGLGFLARVRQAFPVTDGPALDSDTVLARLEAIRPGFRAWAERLGAPRNP
jgi:hypothetical protein